MNKTKVRSGGRGVNNDKTYLQIGPRITLSKEDYIKFRMVLTQKLVTQDKFFHDVVQDAIKQLENTRNASTQRKSTAKVA